MIENVITKIEGQYFDSLSKIEDLWPKIIGAILILAFWTIISIWLYKLVIKIFKKFKLKDLIDKLDIDFLEEKEKLEIKSKKTNIENKEYIKRIKFSDRIKIDKIVAKSVSYYIFLVFFRLSIVFIGIKEVEDFLWDLIAYLPSLFIWIVIWFFGIRFSNFIYDLVYHTLELTKEKTSKIIAMWAKVIILFFTIMLVLNYIKIVDEFIIRTILIWFIFMLALAWWLSFGLWWQKVAREILESFRK